MLPGSSAYGSGKPSARFSPGAKLSLCQGITSLGDEESG